ncbi:hypothetical protein EAE91_00065 [Photorhabdus noenieputensis]|nr:hypothetical protein [Photorhabdus noenieputensis]
MYSLILLQTGTLINHQGPCCNSCKLFYSDIPVIFQVASLSAALTHPSHIVNYAPEDSLPCRRDAS